MKNPRRLTFVTIIGLAILAFAIPACRRLVVGAFVPTRSATDALGRFYNSLDYTPAALVLTSYNERLDTLCGEPWCTDEMKKRYASRYAFPLSRKLNLSIPPAVVHRLVAYERGLAAVETILWASDGILFKEFPAGLDPASVTPAQLQEAINNRTRERIDRWDRIIHVEMSAVHVPSDIVLLEYADRVASARMGAACAVDRVERLDLVRIFAQSPMPWFDSICSRLRDAQRAACEEKRAKQCAFYPKSATSRIFARFEDGGRLRYLVDCGGGYTPTPEQIADPSKKLIIDPLTEYWRSDDPNYAGQTGGPRCSLFGAWGGWRFRALVDRDRPEQWGGIYDDVIKIYDRFVVGTDGDARTVSPR